MKPANPESSITLKEEAMTEAEDMEMNLIDTTETTGKASKVEVMEEATMIVVVVGATGEVTTKETKESTAVIAAEAEALREEAALRETDATEALAPAEADDL